MESLVLIIFGSILNNKNIKLKVEIKLFYLNGNMCRFVLNVTIKTAPEFLDINSSTFLLLLLLQFLSNTISYTTSILYCYKVLFVV